MEEVYMKVKADTKGAQKEVNDLNDTLEDTKTSVEDVGDAADDLSGGMVSKFKTIVKGVKKGIGAFKSLKVAIAATGLGALVLVIGSLVTAFKSSEEGQNQFAKLMGVIRAITAVVIDRVAELGSLIIDVFTKPGEVLTELGNKIQTAILDKVAAVREAFNLFGSAAKKIFGGDFKGAAQDAASGLVQLNNELNPALIITKSLAVATKNLVTEMTKEAKAAANIADMRAKADKADRELMVQRAEANRKRAELLEKSVDKEKFSVQERIEFLQEAAALEANITNKEIEAAQLRLDAKIAENALGLSTKEDLEEEARLKAELINLETARLSKQREVTSQIIAFKAEAKAEEDRITAEAETARKEREAEELKDKEELEKKKLEAEKKANDQRIAMEEAVQAAKQNITMQGLAAIGALANAFAGESEKGQRRAFEIQKRVQMAQTLMSTYQAITDAMAAKGGDALLPFPLRLANAVVAGALGLANVKKISSTQFQSPTTGSTSPTAAIGQTATAGGPSISTIGGTEQTQISALFNQQKPQRAYVTQGDINTNAALDRHVMENATLAG